MAAIPHTATLGKELLRNFVSAVALLAFIMFAAFLVAELWP